MGNGAPLRSASPLRPFSQAAERATRWAGGSTGTRSQPRTPENTAEKLYRAMKGLGTDEKGINAALGQIETQEEWEAVQAAFKAGKQSSTFVGGDLRAALKSELSRRDLVSAMAALWGDGVDPRAWYRSAESDIAARLHNAMKGLGTDEKEIYDGLGWVKTEQLWVDVQQAFASDYPNFCDGMLKDALHSELSGYDLNKAKARLRRNGVQYDDKASRIVIPGDVIDVKSVKGDLPLNEVEGLTYKAFDAHCRAQDVDLVVWIDAEQLRDDLQPPFRLMVDGTMHAAPRILIIGAFAKATGAAIAEYPANKFDPRELLKLMGDRLEERLDSLVDKLHLRKCKKIDDYFERASVLVEPHLRVRKILRLAVTWTFSVAGSMVTLSTGDDKPYHAMIRLWLDGGHVIVADRTDKGILWKVKTPPTPSENEAHNAFFEGIEPQCKARKEGKGEPLATCIEYGSDGGQAIVMVNLHFSGTDPEAPSPAKQAQALAEQLPCYKGYNSSPGPGESPDYADGNLRCPCAEELVVRWPQPTMNHLLCGLYQLADVTYGPPSYFESYHPRKMNCQAFVFDALCVCLTPPEGDPCLTPVVCYFDHHHSLDTAVAAPLLRALKAHVVQDADKMLSAGGDCKLGVLSQAVAEWIMF
mmetsp:Transcript_9892/g.27593  ORF Transcript_9892/g.27593 Transcript_9892/m.27593 type:complete len:642 (-) Transcript_9892:361-2286(-)